MTYVRTDVDLAAAIVGPDGIPLMPEGMLSGGGGPGQVQGGAPQAAALNGDLSALDGVDPALLAAIGADAEGLARRAQDALYSGERSPLGGPDGWPLIPGGFRGGKRPAEPVDPVGAIRDLRELYKDVVRQLHTVNRPIYLFGAMAADKDYKARFDEWHYRLVQAGYRVLSPARQPKGFSNSFYLHHAMVDIDQCDCLLAVPSPFLHESKGARAEAAYAEYAGKDVLWEAELFMTISASGEAWA